MALSHPKGGAQPHQSCYRAMVLTRTAVGPNRGEPSLHGGRRGHLLTPTENRARNAAWVLVIVAILIDLRVAMTTLSSSPELPGRRVYRESEKASFLVAYNRLENVADAARESGVTTMARNGGWPLPASTLGAENLNLVPNSIGCVQ